MVPDFQREFEWKARDIRDLTRSIFLDYYIGSLLLWKGTKENFANLSCEPLYGQKEGSPEFIVLDGQQRLTAINYAFVAPDVKLPTRVSRALYFIRIDRFMAEEYDDAFDFAYVTAGGGDGVAGANRYFGPVEAQFKSHIFPLSILGTNGSQLYKWLGGYKEYWSKIAEDAGSDQEKRLAGLHAANADTFEELVDSIIGKFQISYIELDRDIPIDKVCDIFTQINSKGIRLDAFDLINALLKPKGIQLKSLWRDAAPKLDFLDTSKLNVYILQVMSIQRQAYCSPKYLYYMLPGVERKTRAPDGSFERQIMVATAEDFVGRWERAVKALERAISQLKHPHEFGVSKYAYLPYVSIMPVFAAALSEIEALPATDRLGARARFRLWYWASIFTNRYSASSETTAARDFQDLRKWFADAAAEPSVIDQFRALVPNLDLRTETKKGFAIYNAIFNLLVIAGARDWCSGAVPEPDELDDHHIVPKSWGNANLAGNAIDTILNRTPLTDETNRIAIRDRLPNEYLPELIEKNGRAHIEALMESHFVSPLALNILLREPFTPDDFEAFVRERQRTITQAVSTYLVGGRADLPANLRKLDEAVERIELALRELIALRLDNSLAKLPPHVRSKIDDRVARELKKNPGADLDRYSALHGALEFADLMELMSVMQSGATSAFFTDVFPHKEALIAKFNQLADLRNGIRHSRTVNEIVQKEGEAAILWFDAALKGALATT